MKKPILTAGIGATSIALILTAGGQVLAQSTDSTRLGDRTLQGAGDSMADMQRIGLISQQLNAAVLSSLQEAQRDWRKAPTDPARTDRPAANDLIGGLRGEELLIATCSDGLYGGAPTSMHSTPVQRFDGPDAGDRSDNQGSGDASGTDAGSRDAQRDGESVGMMLVYKNGPSGTTPASSRTGGDAAGRSAQDASADRGVDAARPIGGAMAPLEGGVYCVKRNGASVWLVDENERIVLRTRLDKPGMDAGHKGNGVGGARRVGADSGSGAASTESHPMGDRSMQDQEWMRIFGALVHEASVIDRQHESSASGGAVRR